MKTPVGVRGIPETPAPFFCTIFHQFDRTARKATPPISVGHQRASNVRSVWKTWFCVETPRGSRISKPKSPCSAHLTRPFLHRSGTIPAMLALAEHSSRGAESLQLQRICSKRLIVFQLSGSRWFLFCSCCCPSVCQRLVWSINLPGVKAMTRESPRRLCSCTLIHPG